MPTPEKNQTAVASESTRSPDFLLTRRAVLQGAAAASTAFAAACSGVAGNADQDAGVDAGEALDAGVDAGAEDAGFDAGSEDAGFDGGEADGGGLDGGEVDGGELDGGTDAGPGNRPPAWTSVPDQTWVVGVPVLLDLAAYCTDPDGDALTFSLDLALPPGLTLSGSVISGTPTAVFATASFTATADDGV